MSGTTVPRLTDVVCDLVTTALGNFSQPGEVIGYEAFWTLMASPSGPQPTLFVGVSMASPLLGHQPLTVFQALSMEHVFDQGSVNALVAEAMGDLRSMRSHIIGSQQ